MALSTRLLFLRKADAHIIGILASGSFALRALEAATYLARINWVS
jgi:hypothetical protein